MFFFVALVTAGAAWYGTQVFLPERKAAAYAEETDRLISEMISKGSRLTEATTLESLSAYEREIRVLAERKGVEASMVDPLMAKLDTFKVSKVERNQEFEGLLEAISAFPLNSTRAEIKAFDERIKEAAPSLGRMQGAELQSEWLERRKDVAKNLKDQSLGELTIRSDPSKANVYLDGKLLSNTPFKVSKIRTGNHEIVLKKEGYRDKRISVSIDELGDNDLGTLVLDPIVGGVRILVSGGKPRDKVEIEIEEASESVSVGGLQVVQGYQHFEGREHQLDALRIGNYVLIVSVNGRIAKESSFVVSDGETKQVLVEF